MAKRETHHSCHVISYILTFYTENDKTQLDECENVKKT